MKMCYNIFMKIKFISCLFLFLLTMQITLASPFEVLFRSVSLTNSGDNFYGFDYADETVASDVIKIFNKSFKVHSPDLYSLNSKLNADSNLKYSLLTALKQYKSTESIDYSDLNKVANSFGAKSVLIIFNSIALKNNTQKHDLWEILDVASAFDIQSNYELKTTAILLDNVKNMVMWSATYKTNLNNKDGSFKALNYPQAIEQSEKFKLYSKDILSKNIAQNVTLRFYPQSVRAVEVKSTTDNMDAGILKFDKNIPDLTKYEHEAIQNVSPKSDNDDSEFDEKEYGEILYSL